MSRIMLVAMLMAGTLLCQSDDSRAWDALNQGIGNKSADNRHKAAHALGLMQGDARAQSAAEKLLADEDARVRAAAAGALGEMQAKSAVPKLKQLLHDHESAVVLAAAGALRKLGDETAYGVYYAILTGQTKAGDSLVESQMKIVKDPKALARIGFDQGMGLVPFGGVGLTAFKAVTKDDTSPVRAAAAHQLVSDRDPQAAKALVDALSDKSWLVRAGAAGAIGLRDDPSLMKSLTPVFADSNETVSYTAAAAYLRLNARSQSR